MKDDILGWQTWLTQFENIAEFNSPSELHGLLTGLVCVLEAPSEQEWIEILAQFDVVLEDDALRVLTEEAEDIAALLQEEDMDLIPMVPDDSHILAERALCLSDWCEGVLLGFGLAGGIVRPDERESINDLGFIAALSFDENEEQGDDEQNEAGYAELLEFARLIPCSLSMGRKKQVVKQSKMLKTPMRKANTSSASSVVENFNPQLPS